MHLIPLCLLYLLEASHRFASELYAPVQREKSRGVMFIMFVIFLKIRFFRENIYFHYQIQKGISGLKVPVVS